MSYSVYAYLTDADKVKSVYGACDNLLLNQLKIALKQELDSLNDYFSDSLNTDKDAYAALADIVNGEIRYPEIAFIYGYVYEKICNHYGTQIYCAENLWQLDSQSTFIPIPLSDDFPYIISIPFQIWRASGRNTPHCKRVTVSEIMITSRKWTT